MDVSDAVVKFRRAQEHLAVLDLELRRLKDSDPYTVWHGQMDEDSGWCDVYVRQDLLTDSSATVILGDYVGNLRACLNYLASALVRASGIDVLSTVHAFPVFTSRTKYDKQVVRAGVKRAGMLAGVTIGLDVVRRHQPFEYSKSNPEHDPLAVLQDLTNTDKHRYPATVMFRPEGVQIFSIEGVTPTEQWGTDALDLRLGEDIKVAAFRFDRPFPSELHVEASLSGRQVIGRPTGVIGLHSEGEAIPVEMLNDIQERVLKIVQEVHAL